jgi:hypothetical protein
LKYESKEGGRMRMGEEGGDMNRETVKTALTISLKFKNQIVT